MLGLKKSENNPAVEVRHTSSGSHTEAWQNDLCLRNNGGANLRDCSWRPMSMDFINIAMFVKFKVVSIRQFVLLLWSVYTFSTLASPLFVRLSETGRSLASQGIWLRIFPSCCLLPLRLTGSNYTRAGLWFASATSDKRRKRESADKRSGGVLL